MRRTRVYNAASQIGKWAINDTAEPVSLRFPNMSLCI